MVSPSVSKGATAVGVVGGVRESGIAQSLLSSSWEQVITGAFQFQVADVIVIGSFIVAVYGAYNSRKKDKCPAKKA